MVWALEVNFFQMATSLLTRQHNCRDVPADHDAAMTHPIVNSSPPCCTIVAQFPFTTTNNAEDA